MEDAQPFAEEFTAVLSELSRQLGVLLVPDSGTEDGSKERIQMKAQGLQYLLENPECQNSATLRPLVQAVEEKKILKHWIGEHSADVSPQAFIGSEHEFENLQDYTIVTARYESETSGSSGAVAVIGLKRMDYAKVLPILAEMAQIMGKTFYAMRKG